MANGEYLGVLLKTPKDYPLAICQISTRDDTNDTAITIILLVKVVIFVPLIKPFRHDSQSWFSLKICHRMDQQN